MMAPPSSKDNKSPASVGAPLQVITLDLRKDRRLTKLGTTNATAVYTARAREAPIIELIWITNTDASNACNVTVTLFHAGSNDTYTLYPTTSLAAGGVLVFPNSNVNFDGMPLQVDDEIRVTAGNANDLHVIVVARVVSGYTK